MIVVMDGETERWTARRTGSERPTKTAAQMEPIETLIEAEPWLGHCTVTGTL